MAQQLKPIMRLILLVMMLSVPLVLLGAIIRGLPGAAIGFLLTIVALNAGWLVSRPIIMHMAQAVPADTAQHAKLIQRVERLATQAGIAIPLTAISTLNTPNAFAAATPGGGVVGVTSGLLAMLTDDELEAVVAHEIAHIARGDRMTATLAAVATALPGALITRTGSDLFYSAEFRRSHPRIWGGRRLRLVRDGLALIAVPLSAVLVRLSVSRVAELRADMDAVRLTGNVAAMTSSLRKINVLAGRLISPVNPALSHMLVIHPYGDERIGRMFDTHPGLPYRLRAIEAALAEETLAK